MPTIPRYLITTADERTWKFDRPVVFLGEWCRLYDRKHIWQHMDAVVAEPYGLQIGEKKRDLEYVQELSSRLLDELADALNVFHNTRHSLRYWHIVLGHWLKQYVAVTFNRYCTLEQVMKDHEISGTTVFDSGDYSLGTADFLTFMRACNDDVWNHVLYARILSFWGHVKMELDIEPLAGSLGFTNGNSKTERAPNVNSFIRRMTNNLLPKLRKKHDAFIINSGLPLKEEIKLQLSLGQCPQLWEKLQLKSVVPLPAQRQGLTLHTENYQGFERFIRLQLCEIIPCCYLEGYGELVQQLNSLPWPVRPRFIFTAFSFFSDEIFKAWAASKVEKGVPYFIAQHGNNYGTMIGSQGMPELLTPDNFFTWGWASDNPKIVPAFVFKTAGRKQQRIASNGGLLLIELHPPMNIFIWDDYFEFSTYQEEQFRFVEALPEAIKQKLTVRLHQGYRDLRWSDEQRWKDRSPHTTVETGVIPIQDLIAQSRLVVHSYDSTGILEAFVLNIPTMCFWHGGLDHLLPSAKPYYELLGSVGILHDTPEQAAEMVASVWDNVSEWWLSKKVQDARNAFCTQYAKTVKDPVRTMKRLLVAHEKSLSR